MIAEINGEQRFSHLPRIIPCRSEIQLRARDYREITRYRGNTRIEHDSERAFFLAFPCRDGNAIESLSLLSLCNLKQILIEKKKNIGAT